MRAVAGAVLLGTCLTASNAWALALGRASVQSGLGEPLRAEIDLPAVTSDESASLQVSVADGDAFRAAGMDYNPLLTDIRITVERRSDGRTVLRLTSTRPVNEPFLDMVLQARWASGQLVRGYTMLFDPPNLRTAAAPAPLLPATGGSTSRPVTSAAAPAPSTASPEPDRTERSRAPAVRPSARARTTERPAATGGEGTSVTVQAGDTAGRIAQANKPAEVSLDQMLVAMLRANPNAFINNNVNRIKAGAVLDLPTQASAAGVDAKEAHNIIVGQSRDFREFRRRMAGSAPAKAPAPEQARASSGQVQAEVTEKAAPAPADKLTLSKSAASAKGGSEEKIAQQRQQEATASRTGELSRNLDELNKLQQAASAPAGAPTAAVPTAAPATPAPAPATPAVEAPAAAPPAPVPPPAPAPKPVQPKAAAPAPAPTPSFVEDLLGGLSTNPLALPAAGGVAVLLGGLLWMRRRAAAKATSAASFDDSLVQAGAEDAAGGQLVDTSEQAGPVSSMMYSPSQLDAAGDVDPIAEADVYLAYGRDQQAEEILREALRLHPDRLPLRAKLLEVLAQRQDKTGFEREATELLALTAGVGAEWEGARAMGAHIDPTNPLYQSGSPAAEPTAIEPPAAEPDVPLDLDFGALTPAPEPQSAMEPSPEPEPAAAEDDMLSFSTETAEAEPLPEQPAAEPSPTVPPVAAPAEPAPSDEMGLDFDLDLTAGMAPPAPAPVPAAAQTAADPTGLDFDIELEDEAPAAAPATGTAATLPSDIQDLSLDLPAQAAPAVGPDLGDLSQIEVTEGVANDNPLETKLSLAREFEAIGDTEGARSLAEEVEAEAGGELQARARAFLAQLA